MLRTSWIWVLGLALGIGCSNKSDGEKDDHVPNVNLNDNNIPSTVKTGGKSRPGSNNDVNTVDPTDPTGLGTETPDPLSETFEETPPPPAGGEPGEPTEGEPAEPSEGGPPTPVPTPAPSNVETPEQYELLWTFKDYCMMAESRPEAEKYLGDFPSQEHFESWLLDIQKTVAAIRVRLNVPKKIGVDVGADCEFAYQQFQQVHTLSLAPSGKEVFEIANIDPISGMLPNLKNLNLANNLIVNIKFLRNQRQLETLALGGNLISVIPPMVNPNNKEFGLYKLRDLGIEFQNMPTEDGKPLANLTPIGLQPLGPGKALKRVRINSNMVDPTGLRGQAQDLTVSTPAALLFKAGSDACKAGTSGKPETFYPVQVETERKCKCGGTSTC